jgi:diguanylate cyclase (GGDEF)-like protein
MTHRAGTPPRFGDVRAIASPATGSQAMRAKVRRALGVAALTLFGATVLAPSVVAAQDLASRAREIETYLDAYPKRAVTDLTTLVAQADSAPPAERRFIFALYGQSLVAAGRNADALRLAGRLERESGAVRDNLSRATALLVRGNIESLSGDSAKANSLAKEAGSLVDGTPDPYLTYWSAMTIGVTARGLGQVEESLGNLQSALAAAEAADNPYRRSQALYQLSQLYLSMKQGQNALEASRQALGLAEAAASTHGMARARMAESAAFELLDDPARELAAMQGALAIARKSQSKVTESLALINLSDIELRRRRYSEALEHSRRSLELAREYEHPGFMATSKANMGFALFGLGRASEGKRLADEALADYERTGATAEIASLLGEYGQYLERAGDYKGALAFFHRERKLNEEIAAAAHQKSAVELQEKLESEKRLREIELLNRQNDLNSAELENRQLRERIWWLLAAALAVSCLVITLFYRKLRVTNGLLAQKNRELNFRSSRDPLTALYNRRYFQDFMRDEHVRPERRRVTDAEPSIHALLLIDIDLFKQTNDRYGHAAGDSVLVTVARRLRETLRETDMIVRWGGEEFLVFVPATNAGQLDEIAARIMNAIASEPIEFQRSLIRVTASIGYAPIPLPPDDVTLSWERAISLIDMALYMAKLHGRNCAYGIRGLRRSDHEALASIERDLEKAWENGMVDMHLLLGPDIDAYAAADSARIAAGATD